MSEILIEKEKALESELASVRKKMADEHQAKLKSTAVADRLVYSSHSRCPCGAGLAYDPLFEDENSVFKGPLSGYWDCSAILLGVADQSVTHTGKLPFSFYDVKCERQPSANGTNTRIPLVKN